MRCQLAPLLTTASFTTGFCRSIHVFRRGAIRRSSNDALRAGGKRPGTRDRFQLQVHSST